MTVTSTEPKDDVPVGGRQERPRWRRSAMTAAHSPLSPDQLRARALAGRTLLLGLALVLWDLLSRTIADPGVVSRPTEIAPRLVGQFGDPDVIGALAYTGRSILAAFVLGSLLGIAIGSALGMSRLLHDAFMPPLLFVMSIPKVIFLPIFVLTFGIGSESAVAFATFEASIYVAVCVADGMALVQGKHLRVARAFRASFVQRLWTIVFPAALPGIFTGMWFGMKHAFVGVLTAELWASSDGVGAQTRRYAENLETSNVLALVITVSICAILLGSLWNAVESRLTQWK